MSKSDDLYWINERNKRLRDAYFAFIKDKGWENTFDNCNDYLSKSMPMIISKREYGVSSRSELAKWISEEKPNQFSL